MIKRIRELPSKEDNETLSKKRKRRVVYRHTRFSNRNFTVCVIDVSFFLVNN